VPRSGSAPTVGEPVTRTLTSCPQAALPGAANSRVVAAAVPGQGLGGSGTFRHGAVGGKRAETQLRRGRLVQVHAAPKNSVAVEGHGGIAAGLFGARVDSARSGSLAVTGCATPGASWWFTGAAATLDHSSTLVLNNADPGPAVVDVRVFAPGGEIDTESTLGIALAPGQTRTIPLADVAPQQQEVAVDVQASSGRVVAAVADAYSAGPGAPAGREWLPAATSPSRSVRLAGLSGTADDRTLVVANPSNLEAMVKLQVSGRSGTFTPTGQQSVRVAPGTVKAVDVTKVLGQEPSAVRLSAQVPVLGTIRSTAGGDSSYAATVGPVRDQAVAPLVDGAKATVLLTAGDGAARATATAYSAAGRRTDSRTLRIAPGATKAWTPKRGGYVVVEPQKGEVSGGVTYSGGGTAAVPLVDLPTRLLRPAVSPALSD
jgi:hypothetical protein